MEKMSTIPYELISLNLNLQVCNQINHDIELRTCTKFILQTNRIIDSLSCIPSFQTVKQIKYYTDFKRNYCCREFEKT